MLYIIVCVGWGEGAGYSTQKPLLGAELYIREDRDIRRRSSWMGTGVDKMSDDGGFKELAISLEEGGLKGNMNIF